MKDKIYDEAEYISLHEIIPSNKFRSVLESQLDVPPGHSEIRVTIEMASSSPNQKFLPEIYAESMFVFGYVQDNEKIRRIFSGEMGEEYKNRRISLVDWKNKFLLLFENGTRSAERAFSVKPQDFKALMEKCLHPNIPKRKVQK